MEGTSRDDGSGGQWEFLGGNTIREHEHNDGSVERLISVPRDVIDLIFEGPDEDSDGSGYWAYEPEQGWIILSDCELEGNLVEIRKLSKYTLRGNNSVRIPNTLFNVISESASTIEQGVPEPVALQPDETYCFFTWSTWGEGRPNAVILATIDSLGIPGPEEQGNMGGTGGPMFGGSGDIEPPEPPNFELKAAEDSEDSDAESEQAPNDEEEADDEPDDSEDPGLESEDDSNGREEG